ncbi:hypothetical protein DPX16_0837 [Anabarilius grahami]|uniref:Uncharacterized protein n=1 Tax=Anabarilius grahami TaxID=495550 RepID=A0A3N0Y2V4_ANAGA|nr:hypothetical protein DPX16_0837 [Anabarilius grahami]
MDFFGYGLNEPLKDYLLTNGPRGSFVEFLDFALLTVGSRFTVGVVEDSDTMVNPVMAATPETTHKMVAATTSHATADRPEQRHAAADRPEQRHAAADRPEQRHAAADRQEQRHASRSVRERRGLRSSVADPPLTSTRAVGIPKPKLTAWLSNQPAPSLSSLPAPSLSSLPDASHVSLPVATPSNSPVATPSNSPVATPSNSPVATPSNSPVATHSSALDAMDKMAALPVPSGKTAAPSVLTEVGGVPAIESAPEPASASESAPEPAPTGEPSPHPRKRRRRRKKASSILRGSEAFQEAAGGLVTPPDPPWLPVAPDPPWLPVAPDPPWLPEFLQPALETLFLYALRSPMHPPPLPSCSVYAARTRLPGGGRYVTITVCSCHVPVTSRTTFPIILSAIHLHSLHQSLH